MLYISHGLLAGVASAYLADGRARAKAFSALAADSVFGSGMSCCAECFEGFRPILYGHRIGCFHCLALGFRAQPFA